MSKPIATMLITRPMQEKMFAPEDLSRLAEFVELRPAGKEEMTEAIQAESLVGAEIAITGWGTLPITEAMLQGCPDLRLICHSASSVRSLVTDAVRQRPIRVSTARQANGRGVAEFAFAQMLLSMKATWQFIRGTQEGNWIAEGAADWICEPYGATVGIIGASAVGRDMIRLCKTLPLGALLLCDPYVPQDEAHALGVELTLLEDLLRRSDVVSLHAPATEETRHMFNAETLALMKERAIFINTARGALVDEAALIAELEKGRLLACLDVTDPEPPAPGSPLWTLPNCILTPHIAGSLKENCHGHGFQVVQDIAAYVAGRPLLHELPMSRFEQMG